MNDKVIKACFDTTKALELYGEGKSDQEIADGCFCHKVTLARWRRKMGLPSNIPPSIPGHSRFEWLLAWELHQAGVSDIEIAAALKCSRPTVWKWRKRNGLKPNIKRRKKHA